MDPLTQGVLGASLSQLSSAKKNTAIAGVLGFFAGMAADLDILIRSSTDPILFLEYHRQFTHSLVFIPVGGLITALVLYGLFARRWQLSFIQTAIYCTLGYATHAILDTCTTYGTQLLWPVSDQRFAWNIMSIIDPLYTLPILGLVILAAKKNSVLFAKLAMIWVLSYPLMGVVQRERAEAVGLALAHERGHYPVMLEAKPSFANLLVLKIVYQTDKRYFVDAVRVGFDNKIYPGESIAKLDLSTDLLWLDADSQQAQDIERFRWFSNGYLAVDPDNVNRLVDVRYSLVPNEVKALWGIILSPDAGPEQHVIYDASRDAGKVHRDKFWQMLLGENI